MNPPLSTQWCFSVCDIAMLLVWLFLNSKWWKLDRFTKTTWILWHISMSFFAAINSVPYHHSTYCYVPYAVVGKSWSRQILTSDLTFFFLRGKTKCFDGRLWMFFLFGADSSPGPLWWNLFACILFGIFLDEILKSANSRPTTKAYRTTYYLSFYFVTIVTATACVTSNLCLNAFQPWSVQLHDVTVGLRSLQCNSILVMHWMYCDT